MLRKKISVISIISILLGFYAFSPLICQHSLAKAEPAGKVDTVYYVPVSGEIGLRLAPLIKRVTEEADQEKVKALILEINTFGGRLDAAVEIRDALVNTKTLTIAFINERAISAGALISLACQKIVMAPAATIGAATPVAINPFNDEVKPAREKIISYFRKEMKATAERHERPTSIAEAMVDPDIAIEGLIEKGKVLTLTTSEALQHKLADMEISGGIEEIMSAFHLNPSRIITKETNLTEKFLGVISGSLISSLLLVIGMLGLFLEFRTPTWGVAGTIGLLCIILFLWGHWALNLVGLEELLLIVIGTVLLLLEVFVIPGFGIVGILGIICLTTGLVLSLVGKHPTFAEIWKAISHVSIVFICVIILSILFLKYLSKTKSIQRFVLHTKARQPAYIDPFIETEAKRYTSSSKKDHYLGREGVAYTNLRPAGKGIFGKERLNVVTEGDFLEKGAPIRIIGVQGSNIIVQKIKGSNPV